MESKPSWFETERFAFLLTMRAFRFSLAVSCATTPAMTDVSTATAVFAGVLSFLSPCVLPLVPPYLTYIAGQSVEDFAASGARRARRDIILAAAIFVLGFSTVFVALGATASTLGLLLRAHLDILSKLAGVAILLMGAHFLGLFRFAFLYREKRLHVEKPVGLWGAYVMGSPLRSVGRRASGRSLRRSWPSPVRKKRPCVVRRFWPFTRWGSAFRFCSLLSRSSLSPL